MKEKFIELYNAHIHREGSETLLAWLEKSDFFTAPASTKFHLAEHGGLCTHSVHVFERLVQLYKTTISSEISDETMETLAICGLLHDLCKTNFYKVSTKNVKNSEGKWVQEPFFTIEDSLPYGHGEKSVYMISGFIRMTRDEAMAVRWHMGGFDESVKGGSYAMSNAYSMFKLAPLLHAADMLASYIDEVDS